MYGQIAQHPLAAASLGLQIPGSGSTQIANRYFAGMMVVTWTVRFVSIKPNGAGLPVPSPPDGNIEAEGRLVAPTAGSRPQPPPPLPLPSVGSAEAPQNSGEDTDTTRDTISALRQEIAVLRSGDCTDPRVAALLAQASRPKVKE